MYKRLIPLMLGLTLMAAGCGADRQTSTGNTAPDSGEVGAGAAPTVEEVAANAALTARVKTALYTLKGVEATEVNVDSNNGVVTLDGFVSNANLKKAALDTAKRTEGVKSVVDKLKVGAPGPNDGAPGESPTPNPL